MSQTDPVNASANNAKPNQPSLGGQFRVHTFGCKVNTYDSGLLQRNLVQAGFDDRTQFAKETTPTMIHVLNTCAVTSEASKEAQRLARRLKAKDPLSTVVVTGCAAQVDSELFADLPSVDLIVANSHKGSLPFILDQHLRRLRSGNYPSSTTDPIPPAQKLYRSNIFRKMDFEPGGGVESTHTRSFLKIQDGCNSFCSFCIIPYARGTSRSLSIQELVVRCQQLEQQNVREVVLTGVHIGDYSDPTSGLRLEDLVAQLLKRTRNLHFRLTSLEPIELSEKLFELFQDPRLNPHFHMSLQSAETRVLRAMKRQYGEKEVRTALEKIAEKVPGAFVGLDVIAGFPTETDEEFARTYQVLQETPWSKIHVFPYSERKGTKALLLDPVKKEIRAARAMRLRELSAQRWMQIAATQVGREKKALVIGKGDRALTTDYWNLHMSERHEVGNWIQVKVQEVLFEKESLGASAFLS